MQRKNFHFFDDPPFIFCLLTSLQCLDMEYWVYIFNLKMFGKNLNDGTSIIFFLFFFLTPSQSPTFPKCIFSLPSKALSFFLEAKQRCQSESIQLLPFGGSPSSIIEMKMIGMRWDQSLCLHDLLVVVLPPLVCYVGMKWYRPVLASIMW